MKVVVNLGKTNVGPDHLSNIRTKEITFTLDELLDGVHFWVESVPDYFIEMTMFSNLGFAPKLYDQKRQVNLVVIYVKY